MQKTTDSKELVNDMFEAGAHKGFVRSRRHPSVAKYLHSSRSRKDIINLETTANLLAQAEEYATTLGRLGKVVVFVGTKPETKEMILQAAEKTAMPYVSERWIGGTLTNIDEIKKRINHYNTLRKQRDTDSLVYKTKKEKLMIEREIAKLERNFHGISEMESIPDAMFVIDIKHEMNAVTEAKKLRVPVISLSSTDCDLSFAQYPIVANDTLVTSLKFFIDRITNAILAGKKA